MCFWKKVFLGLQKLIVNGEMLLLDFRKICLRTINGTHVTIQVLTNSASLFYSYKKSFSIVLLAVCNYNYEFTMIDIGEAGKQSDGGIFSSSTI